MIAHLPNSEPSPKCLEQGSVISSQLHHRPRLTISQLKATFGGEEAREVMDGKGIGEVRRGRRRVRVPVDLAAFNAVDSRASRFRAPGR
jgi:hypothetical protein